MDALFLLLLSLSLFLTLVVKNTSNCFWIAKQQPMHIIRRLIWTGIIMVIANVTVRRERERPTVAQVERSSPAMPRRYNCARALSLWYWTVDFYFILLVQLYNNYRLFFLQRLLVSISPRN